MADLVIARIISAVCMHDNNNTKDFKTDRTNTPYYGALQPRLKMKCNSTTIQLHDSFKHKSAKVHVTPIGSHHTSANSTHSRHSGMNMIMARSITKVHSALLLSPPDASCKPFDQNLTSSQITPHKCQKRKIMPCHGHAYETRVVMSPLSAAN